MYENRNLSSSWLQITLFRNISTIHIHQKYSLQLLQKIPVWTKLDNGRNSKTSKIEKCALNFPHHFPHP